MITRIIYEAYTRNVWEALMIFQMQIYIFQYHVNKFELTDILEMGFSTNISEGLAMVFLLRFLHYVDVFTNEITH